MILSIAIPLLFALAIYWIGGRISAKGSANPGKVKPYACGEDLPGVKFNLDITRFYVYLVYFMIFDILGVILSLAFTANPIYIALFIAPTIAALLFIAIRVEDVGG
ncbi:MAG: NADH-quinone oxidoreductase subunit A [Candidatus Bathyarchaeota archaeon]|nr:NADH-quinone oxidoreductase subunit A [Candidatus Bathyarchaeota archaeon]